MSLSQLTSTIGTVRPDATLREAARVMTRDSIGSLLICKEAGAGIEGILTDRDIVREIAEGHDPEQATVAAFVGRPVKTLPQESSRHEITSAMRMHGVRRIPLVDDDGKVTAMVSLDDLLVETGEELFDLSRAIRKEFQNEAPEPDPSE